MIRTILGDIPPEQLGVCYAHEHIIIDASFTTARNPEFLLDCVDAASRELADFHAIGGCAMIDSMPCDCGRNVMKLADDSAFRWKPGQGNPTLDLLVALSPEFPDQVILGMDAARRSYWKHHGGSPGMNFLLTTFTEQMKSAGLTDDDLQRIFVANPAKTYNFCGGAI